MRELLRKILIFLLAILPTIISIQLMIFYFPATGLGRILTVPFTYMVNVLIILIGMFISSKIAVKNNRLQWFNIFIWIAIILMTIIIVIVLHPQEYGPTPWRVILNNLS
ncbi:hypothetical protein ASD24_14745 [Paenibacillus sp. Root52]|nr:hypothetical protein ASD24_14745 [Paenibacillus sp. Root52]